MKRHIKKVKDKLSILNGLETFIALMIGLMFIMFVLALATEYTSKSASAATVDIGTYNGDRYVYDDTNVIYVNNIRVVWIATASRKFNFTKDSEYAGAAGQYGIDCSGHTSVLLGAVIFAKANRMIKQITLPKEKWEFKPIEEHTPQYMLYRMMCVNHPIL